MNSAIYCWLHFADSRSMKYKTIQNRALIYGFLFIVATTSAWAANTTGIWEPLPSMRSNGRRALESLRDNYPLLVRAEAGDFLTRLGLFARQIKIAHSEAKVTIVSDDRKKFSVVVRPKAYDAAQVRRKLKNRIGRQAYIKDGYLTIEQRGRHSKVTSIYALVPKERLLCQAVTIQDLGNRRKMVLKHVLQPSQSKERLPNPWKEPPSILPPVHKRRSNGFQRGVQQLLSIGQMAVPFL